MKHVCPDCRNTFVQPFTCTTCGAEKLYDATLRAAQAELARMRPVFDTGMSLFNNKRHGLDHPPHGLDCEGEYWIVRAKWRDVKAFRAACARAARNGEKG